MELSRSLSAILFYQAEPMTVKRLAGILKRPESDIRDVLGKLEEDFAKTGICLLRNGEEITLGTTPEASALIEAMTKEELSRDLSKATLESLSIILYKGPITRSEIDYVRGVNSTFILRNLLIRGLIERIDNPTDQRSFLYKPTFQLLEYMGVSRVEDLPQYAESMATLAQFVSAKEEGALSAQTRKEESLDEQPFTNIHADETSTPGTTGRVSADEEEADVAETDEAGENFDDTELEEHREEDHLNI